VVIGHTPVSCEYIDSSEIVVNATPLTSGFKTVKITNPDGSHLLVEDVLFYSSDLTEETNEGVVITIDYVNPAIVPIQGGLVEITGKNFVPGKTIVKVDNNIITNVECSKTSLRFRAPSLKVGGFKTVEILNPGKYLLENVLLYSDVLTVEEKSTKSVPESPKSNGQPKRVWGKSS